MDTSTTALPSPSNVATSWWTRTLRAAVLRRLARLPEGGVVVRDAGGEWPIGRGWDAEKRLLITVSDPRAYAALVFGGATGAADAFARGYWTADDLPGLVRLVARHREFGNELDGGMARLSQSVFRLMHFLRANTRWGSRQNIRAHYDLGNDFFESILDETMAYSCAIFPSDSATLPEASTHKHDVVCRKLQLSTDDELLEIGGGWGGLALHAASRYGCRVVTTTISRAQHWLASERVRAAGLEDRITVLRDDYRDLPHRLQRQVRRLVSIEMVEAVGRRYLERYFATCSRLLAPGGRMVLQSIVIAEDLFERYSRSVDFIQSAIFPGGFLPSLSVIRAHAEAHGLHVAGIETLTPHYVRTLQQWRCRLLDNAARLRQLGYGDDLLRLWEYYFSYCEGGFSENTIGVVQVQLERAARAEPVRPSALPFPAGGAA